MSSAIRADVRRPHSIFTTIIVLMTITTSVLFFGFAAFHLVVAARTQRNDHEQYITTTLHFIRAELEGTLEEGELEREELEEIEDVVLRENTSRRFGRLLVTVFDEQGQTILETSGARELIRRNPPFPVAATTPSASTISYWEAPDGGQYVLSSLRTSAPDGRVRDVRLALDWSAAEDKVEAFRRQSLAAALVFTIVAALAAALVIRHALRPLSVIRDAAESIRRGSFDARLEPERLPAELSDLAKSFERMQEHLKESFERLSEFSAELAHELRTPVNNLMGETEVVLSKPRAAEEYQEILASNLEEMARLSRMIDSLLFLSHASRGSAPFATERLDLGSEADSVIEYHQPLAEDLRVKLTRQGTATLDGDRTLVRRALSNVLSNALQASSQGGTVSISIEKSTEGTNVTVSDDGIGIAADDLPRVFERFSRSPEARTRRPEGSGLGLAIVKSIVTLHGGSVSIDSTPGLGTTVSLIFPRAEE